MRSVALPLLALLFAAPLQAQEPIQEGPGPEAVVLSGFGGLVGIVGGTGLANLIRLLLGKWVTLPPVHTPLWAILIAFGFCAFLGILFGIYPAAKASKAAGDGQAGIIRPPATLRGRPQHVPGYVTSRSVA